MMTHQALSDFHFRPVLLPKESWPAYLGRFAAENVLDGLPDLAKCLGLAGIDLLCSRPTQTCGVLGFQLIKSSTQNRWSHATTNGRSWHARVCPLCFREPVKFGRALWDRPIQLRCPEHECLLVDRCSACQIDIRHDRKQFSRCECGQDFAALQVARVPGWVIAMEVAFAEAVIPDAVFSEEVSLPIERKAARALSYFARVKLDPARYWDRTSRDLLTMILSPQFGVLEQCFQESRIGMPSEFREQYAKSNYQQVRDVHDRLSLASFAAARAVASKVRNHDSGTAWGAQNVPFARQFTHRWLHELAEATQLRPHELRSLSSKNLIDGVHRLPCAKTGKFKHVLDAERFAEIEAECEKSATFVKAANRLSVSTATVKHVVERRLLGDRTLRPAYLQRLIDSDAFFDFDVFLGTKSHFEQSLPANDRVYLGDVLEQQIASDPSTGASCLFEALEQDKLSLYVTKSQPRSLADYYFDRDAIQEWRRVRAAATA